MSDNQTPESELETNFELAVRLTAFNDADDILELHRKIVTAATRDAQKALLELVFDNIGGEDIKVRAWATKRRAELAALERQPDGEEDSDA